MILGDTSGDTFRIQPVILQVIHLEIQSDTSGDTSGDTNGDTSGDTSGDTTGDTGDTSGDTTGDTNCIKMPTGIDDFTTQSTKTEIEQLSALLLQMTLTSTALLHILNVSSVHCNFWKSTSNYSSN